MDDPVMQAKAEKLAAWRAQHEAKATKRAAARREAKDAQRAANRESWRSGWQASSQAAQAAAEARWAEKEERRAANQAANAADRERRIKYDPFDIEMAAKRGITVEQWKQYQLAPAAERDALLAGWQAAKP